MIRRFCRFLVLGFNGWHAVRANGIDMPLHEVVRCAWDEAFR